MGLFKKKSNNENDLILDEELNDIPKNHMKDDWVRSDYILVSNKTSAKDLKPYQRMVVLRKPSGQQKYIIDKSLPYSEIKQLQNLIEKRKPIDINSNKLKRIIPNEYKIYEEIEENLSIEDYEKDLKVLKDLNSGEFNEHLFDNEIKSLLKMEDDFSKISLKSSKEISGVNDVDIIDSVKIYIPHEERKIKWNTFDSDELNDATQLIENENISSNPENIELVDESLPLDSNYEIYDDNSNESIEENVMLSNDNDIFLGDNETLEQNYDDNVVESDNVPENEVEFNNYENQEKDYDGDILTTNTYVDKPKQTITSFFKNEIDISDYEIQNQERRNNYYRFYNDTNDMPIEKVVFNKKLNMFTMRRKIDKNLIEEKNRKN